MKKTAARKHVCSFPDCGRRSYSKGLCWTHYRQLRATGKLRPVGWRTEIARLKKEYTSEFYWWRMHRARLPERLHDFKAFIEEVGRKPEGWSTAECVDGRYKWLAIPKRNLIEHNGKSMNRSEWARQLGISPQLLSYRLKRFGVSSALSGEWLDGRLAEAVQSGRDPAAVAEDFHVTKAVVTAAVKKHGKTPAAVKITRPFAFLSARRKSE